MSVAASTPEAWATLSLKALPHQRWSRCCARSAIPSAVLAATRAQLAAVVPDVVAARIREPVDADDAGGDARVARRSRARNHRLGRPGLSARAARAGPSRRRRCFSSDAANCSTDRRWRSSAAATATAQGAENARAFAQALSQAGLTIVSGLAVGVDAAAHEGALTGAGSTLAVVGTGLDRVYPARNRELAHRIAEGGGLLSEFPPGTPPREKNFPRRNRLISGLARGVLVVEAALSSGSLITARYAGEQGREVFAIPGSIHSPLSKGCHKLIREGAKLVETAQDILEELGMSPPEADAATQKAIRRRRLNEASLTRWAATPPTSIRWSREPRCRRTSSWRRSPTSS